jgi:Kef-type K+ transport system membrane component KefB
MLRPAAVYVAMLVGAVALFFAIDTFGKRVQAPAPSSPTRISPTLNVAPAVSLPQDPKPNVFAHVLIALLAVLATGQLLGALFRRIGQPPVIGEVVGGILLGPSLLGQIWPAAAGFILPPTVTPYLEVIAQLGVTLYMFLVGLEINPAALRERARSVVAISHASIVVPFIAGAALALLLYPRYAGDGVPFTGFALFVGVALSITAFPVLARILTDRRMQRTPLGVLALGCAAIGDVTAWCLLAFVVGVTRSDPGGAFVVLGLTAALIGFMFLAVRPVAAKLLARFDEGGLTPNVVALVFGTLLLSALATEAIGIHALFGAFLLGAVIPHDSTVARTFTRMLEDLVTVLLLPAFFALTGMQTRIELISGTNQWFICGLIVLVATAGKFGGTFVSARFAALSWREAAGLGLLMNTRGLMELIALNIGLDMGILSPALFAMMVLMALATTVATTPLLQMLRPFSLPVEAKREPLRQITASQV